MMATKPNNKVKTKPRKRQLADHRSFKLTKKRIKQAKPLDPPLVLIKNSVSTFMANKRTFFGITLVYTLLSFVLIQGFGSTFSLNETKQQLEEVLGGESSRVSTSFALFGYLLGTFGSQSTDTTGTYQLILTLITALATIWAARQIASGGKPLLRDAYYKGMYPLVPFILVALVIGLQLLPAVFGNFLYSTVISQGLAVSGLEQFIWLLFFILLSLLSLYMITSSVFALYISTLPDTRPVQALRSARDLVLHRRLSVLARIILLPIVLLLAAIIIFVPLVMFIPIIVEPLFLIGSAAVLVFYNLYMYNLYRSLL
jgi:hypothetical protein